MSDKVILTTKKRLKWFKDYLWRKKTSTEIEEDYKEIEKVWSE